MSLLFEIIAQNLIDCPLAFDGVTELTAKIRKPRQIVFTGKMWTLSNNPDELLQSFKAIVSDKRITKQGIRIKIWVGYYFGEGELSEA